MKVEITIKVDGRLVKRHVEQVGGTLEQMEETIDALSRSVASDTLQASVSAVEQPRPLFRQPAADCGTKGTSPAR
jgi:hypothetical protein